MTPTLTKAEIAEVAHQAAKRLRVTVEALQRVCAPIDLNSPKGTIQTGEKP